MTTHITTRVRNPLSQGVARDILRRIYMEKPAYWPHGLTVGHHDELWLIRDGSTMQPVGFTGWQKRSSEGKTIGYYSIGVLPEYRRQGFGKAAVAALVDHIRPQVDEVRAFIVPGNEPSMGLARELDLPIHHKVAAMTFLRNVAAPIAGGVAGYLGGENVFGQTGHGADGQPIPGAALNRKLVNTALGAMAGATLRTGGRSAFRPGELLAVGGSGISYNLLNHASDMNRYMRHNIGAVDRVSDRLKYTVDNWTGSDEAQRADTESVAKRTFEQVSKALPWALPTLAVGSVAVPALMAYRAWQGGRQLKALKGEIPLDDPVLERPDDESDEPEEGDELPAGARAGSVKAAALGKVLRALPQLAGAGAGGYGGYRVADQMTLPDAENRNLALTLGALFGAGAGSSLPKAYLPARLGGARTAAAQAGALKLALGSGLGSVATNLGVNFSDTLTKGRELVMNEEKGLPMVMRAGAEMARPFSGANSLMETFEKHPWLKGMSLATIPLSLLSLGALMWSQRQQEQSLREFGRELVGMKRKQLERTGNTRATVEGKPTVYLSSDPDAPATTLSKVPGGETFIEPVVNTLNEMPTIEEVGGEMKDELIDTMNQDFNPMRKAAAPWVRNVLGPLAAGLGTAVASDRYYYEGKPLLSGWDDRERQVGALTGLLSGAYAGRAGLGKNVGGRVRGANMQKAVAALGLVPAERLAILGGKQLGLQNRLATEKLNAPDAPPPAPAQASIGQLVKDNPGATAALALGLLGGVGYLGHRAVKALEKPQETVTTINQAPAPGRVKVTLPTRHPGDAETTVDLPLPADMGSLDISQSLFDTLGRDTRRRLRAEARERVRRKRVGAPVEVEAEPWEEPAPKEAAFRKIASLLS